MKNSNCLWLALLAMVAGWTSVETFRLWEATEQITASQELQLRVNTRYEAARAKNARFAQTDSLESGTPSAAK